MLSVPWETWLRPQLESGLPGTDLDCGEIFQRLEGPVGSPKGCLCVSRGPGDDSGHESSVCGGQPGTFPLPSFRSWLPLHPGLAAPYKAFLSNRHHSVLTSMTNTHSWPS